MIIEYGYGWMDEYWYEVFVFNSVNYVKLYIVVYNTMSKFNMCP